MSPEELYKIILEVDDNWNVSSIELDNKIEEVNVMISYCKRKALDP